MTSNEDRGDTFDGVKLGRPATGALIDAGYTTLQDLPADLDSLLALHGVGPSAVERLKASTSLILVRPTLRRQTRPGSGAGSRSRLPRRNVL